MNCRSDSSSVKRVLIMGGGIAGIAAACSLADAGHAVTLVEKRPYLGGRAFSFKDPDTDVEVDNGQHVFLGCCQQYIHFLQRLGTWHQARLQPSLDIRIRDHKGRIGRLRASALPAPFHTLPAFLRYPHLGWRDKLSVLYGLLRARYTRRHRPDLERQSFYHWLKAHHQSEHAIESFWGLVVLPTLNDRPQDVSASMGLMVFQEALLGGRHGGDLGYSQVGLSQLMGQAAQRYIEQRGGALLLGTQVSRIQCNSEQVTGVELASGETLHADTYISALPFDVLSAVLPPSLTEQGLFQAIRGLSFSPIVNVHVWYDRPVMEGDFVALLGNPLQWVFNKSLILDGGSALSNDATSGQYLCASISGAWDYIHRPKTELEPLFRQAMGQAFPLAATAHVERMLIVKQEHATFRCLPGTASCRPSTVTPLSNLLLAGEWTDTGWPSTMEGAVRSGYKAAHVVLDGVPR